MVERVGDALGRGLEREQRALAVLLRIESIVDGFHLCVDRLSEMPEGVGDRLIDVVFELFAFFLELLVVVEGADLFFEAVYPGLQVGGLVVDLVIELHGFAERQNLRLQIVDGDLQLSCLCLVVALLLAELVFKDAGELVVVILDGFQGFTVRVREELVELFQVTGGDARLPRKGRLHDRESAVDRVELLCEWS